MRKFSSGTGFVQQSSTGVGIDGNEEADTLAGAGLSSAFVEPEPCIPLARSSVKRRERECLLKLSELGDCLSKKPNLGLMRYFGGCLDPN
jgi:hypothetical protein